MTGDVDLIDNIEYASSRALEGTAYEALPLPDAAWHGVICDVRVEPFTDPQVITAMKMALDRQQVVDVVYAGFASVAADPSSRSAIPTSRPTCSRGRAMWRARRRCLRRPATRTAWRFRIP